MKSPIFIASLQSILTLPHLTQKISTSPHTFYLTNKYSQTLWNHQPTIKSLSSLKNVKIIQNYQSALSQIEQSKQKLILIVGDPHHHLHERIRNRKFMTLEELCGVFPEKVPLSYRNRDNRRIREKLEHRLEIKLDEEPVFQHVLVTSHDIKMWDQAIQVLLDLHPSDIIVQYQIYKKNPQFHNLSLQDFLQAFKTCQNLIIPNLPKHHHHRHNSSKIIDFNQNNQHIKWIIEQYQLANKPRSQAYVQDQLLSEGICDIEGYASVRFGDMIF